MRIQRGLAALLAAGLVLSGCSEPSQERATAGPSPSSEPSPSAEPTAPSTEVEPAGTQDETIGAFSLDRAMGHVRNLAGGRGIGTRVRTTRNERLGARYAASKLRSFGYDVTVPRFRVDGRRSRNVVAKWPGSIRHPIVIGAHMDTVPGSPGANDNASGSATVLEVARLVAGKRPSKYIRWVLFGSEEYGEDGTHHVGSEVYVRRLGDRGRDRTPGMVSVDMIADGRPLLVGTFGIGPSAMGRMLFRMIERYTNVAIRYETMCDCSDNGPFEHAGIPGAFMYSGKEPDYHSPSDTVPNLRPADLKRTGRALMSFVRHVRLSTVQRLRRH